MKTIKIEVTIKYPDNIDPQEVIDNVYWSLNRASEMINHDFQCVNVEEIEE